MDIKKFFKKNKIKIILFSFLFILVNYISNYFRIYSNDLLNSINYLFSKPTILLRAFPISLNPKDLLFSIILTLITGLFLLDRKSNKKSFRKGVEHGSAEWGEVNKDLKGMYNEEDNTKNILFSESVKMAIENDDLSEHKSHRNKNTIVVGGSGSGKTRSFVKPNIMQMNSDYVVTDPKGSILNEVGDILRTQKNYNIKVLNLIDFEKSMRYNPLAYVKNEQDILKVVETIIKNTSGKDAKEDFWVTAEKLLYQALLSIILDYFEPEEKHLGTLADLLSLFEVKENDENYVSEVDEMFLEIEEYEPNAFCVKQYRAFKISAGETAKSILISCSARLAPLNIPSVRDLLSTDELELDQIGNEPLLDKQGNITYDDDNNIIYRPNALFIIIPDTDSTFNFIASIMYTQMFNILVTKADNEFYGKFPRHIRFLLDEFANIGEIPDFQTLIATIRSRNISATVILQTLSQLKSIYKDNSDTIVGNCDTLVFLGGKEDSTLKLISNQLGKSTIDDYNTSKTRSQSDSYGQNYSKLGRELMTPDELQKMDRSKCIVMISNLPPFIDNKFDITKHPMYKFHGKPPVIDKRTGEIISQGEFWFNTDRYVQNYRIIYDERMKEVYRIQKLNNKKIQEEKRKIQEDEINIEEENKYEKESLKNITDELINESKENENINIIIHGNNSVKKSLVDKQERVKTNKKPEQAI